MRACSEPPPSAAPPSVSESPRLASGQPIRSNESSTQIDVAMARRTTGSPRSSFTAPRGSFSFFFLILAEDAHVERHAQQPATTPRRAVRICLSTSASVAVRAAQRGAGRRRRRRRRLAVAQGAQQHRDRRDARAAGSRSAASRLKISGVVSRSRARSSRIAGRPVAEVRSRDAATATWRPREHSASKDARSRRRAYDSQPALIHACSSPDHPCTRVSRASARRPRRRAARGAARLSPSRGDNRAHERQALEHGVANLHRSEPPSASAPSSSTSSSSSSLSPSAFSA